jgi:hypothetical protein
MRRSDSTPEEMSEQAGARLLGGFLVAAWFSDRRIASDVA